MRISDWSSDVCSSDLMGLGLAAGVGDGAEVGRADGRRVAPDGARLVVVAARLPLGFARGQLVVGQLDVERALLGIDGDDVAVLEQADRAADRRLRPDVADAEAARGAREAPVDD